jgi:Zn-dependent protease
METLYYLPGLILGFTIHEFFHAYVAYKLGDPTAKEQGRISLNPLKHVTILGMALFIFAGFGYAKPVLFSPENLKNPRRDEVFIAVAGPLSNFILGIILISLFKVFRNLPLNTYISIPLHFYNTYLKYILYFLFFGAYLNFSMCIFNMLPIPPLDGSHVLLSFLNISGSIKNNIFKSGGTILFAIIMAGRVLEINILPIGRMTNVIMKFFI